MSPLRWFCLEVCNGTEDQNTRMVSHHKVNKKLSSAGTLSIHGDWKLLQLSLFTSERVRDKPI